MKKSLRQKLESVVVRMENRLEMLRRNVKEYKEENRLQEAIYNQIKADQFEIILDELKEILNEN